MKKNIIVDLHKEHEAIKEQISKLPSIGKVIEIVKRDKSNYGGARKNTTAVFEVVEIRDSNKLVGMVNVKSKVRECYSFFDLTTNKSIAWRELDT
ncbi:MAG: hypothetical protein IBX70_12315 [Clostridia bacterium]|nr:hypothetical protein [Clostridia bacterium]